jgi:hypothetical protein
MTVITQWLYGETAGISRADRLLSEFGLRDRTAVAKGSKWRCYRENCGVAGIETLHSQESNLLWYSGWMAEKRERKFVLSPTFLQRVISLLSGPRNHKYLESLSQITQWYVTPSARTNIGNKRHSQTPVGVWVSLLTLSNEFISSVWVLSRRPLCAMLPWLCSHIYFLGFEILRWSAWIPQTWSLPITAYARA